MSMFVDLHSQRFADLSEKIITVSVRTSNPQQAQQIFASVAREQHLKPVSDAERQEELPWWWQPIAGAIVGFIAWWAIAAAYVILTLAGLVPRMIDLEIFGMGAIQLLTRAALMVALLVTLSGWLTTLTNHRRHGSRG